MIGALHRQTNALFGNLRPVFAIFGGALVVVGAGTAGAQTGAAKPTASEYYSLLCEARAALDRNDFSAALPLYEHLARANPHDGENWLQLGRCQLSAKRPAAAADSLARGYELGFGSRPTVALQIAGAYAWTGHRDQSLAWLDRALEQRLTNRGMIRIQGNMKSLLQDPEVQQRAGALPPPADRTAGWQGDLDFLRSEAIRLHPRLDHQTPRHDWEAALARVRDVVAELSDEQLLFEVQRILALIGDGHTRVQWDTKLVQVRQLPLRFYWFSDGVYVVDAPDELADCIGARVTHVGDVPVEEAIERLQVFVSRDNAWGARSHTMGILTLAQALETVKLAEPGAAPRFQLADRQGIVRTVAPAPRPLSRRGPLPASKIADAPPAPLWLQSPERNLWFRWLSQPSALYVQFNGVGDEKGQTLAQAAERVREELTRDDCRTLIVDMRNNGGGNTFLYLPLLKALIQFDMARPGSRTFVIIGRWTYSAAQNFITDVDRLTEAVFVGEPSGGCPNSYGENSHTRLPYSGLVVTISNLHWQHSYPTDHRQWIAPEIPVELTSADYFANHDPALEAIEKVLASAHQVIETEDR